MWLAGIIHVGMCLNQGWQVSSIDGNNHGKNQVSSVTEEILSSLPFWEEMEETNK